MKLVFRLNFRPGSLQLKSNSTSSIASNASYWILREDALCESVLDLKVRVLLTMIHSHFQQVTLAT